jgi:hypothetical protein
MKRACDNADSFRLGDALCPSIAVGMATVLMTNPPGLSLAVIGNPRRGSTSKGTIMPKRSTKRRAARAAAAARSATRTRRRRARRARRARRTTTAAASTAAPARPATAPTRRNPSRKYWRVGKRIPWKNPGVAVAGSRRRSRRRTAHDGGGAGHGSGLMSDFAGLGAALADIGARPLGLAWAAGGAAATAIGGNLVAAQVARLMPSMGAGLGRMMNAAVFAGVAVGASRLARNPTQRRQLLAGGLAVAAIELLSPGKSYDAVAKVPVLNRLLPAPPVGADPAVLLAMQRRAGAAPGVAGSDDGTDLGEVEPVAIDGVADVGNAEDAGEEAMGELVPTYLNGLGCPLTARSNELTKLVTP